MTAPLMVAAGLLALIAGGELLVRGSVSAARAFGVSPMVIGLTLVGFGTSTPELATSLQAALSGAPGIAIGNVVGSNIGNVLLILGLTALLAPIAVDPRAFRRDGSVALAATALCLAAVLAGEITRGLGIVFLIALAAYLAFIWRAEGRGDGTPAGEVYAAEAEIVAAPTTGAWRSLGLALAGLAATLLGARFLVAGAAALADAAGVSETVIGLTVVAIGTSTPELVTSLAAVRGRQMDVALGNVLGSNIFNILGILGATALVQPLAVPERIGSFDIWVMCAAALLMGAFARTGWRIGRAEGAAMLAAYAAYLVWLASA